MRIWPGKPYPLGSTWDGMGVNFALFSENAQKVELCLFDSVDAVIESKKIILTEYTDQVWHVYSPDIKPGQLYGYRVHGAYDPNQGLRFNSQKVLLDPYAKAIMRSNRRHEALFAYRLGSQHQDLESDNEDNAAYALLGIVIDPAFTWGSDSPLRIPWNKTVIYETHVKGISMLHPEVPPEIRGTYAGLASEPIIKHLTELGITAVELMPVHYKVDEKHLLQRGLSNYWGYNTIGYFAPDSRYAASRKAHGHIREFKTMVRALHAAGLEVILDVVYNHTGEGNNLGPTLSFKGIDNLSYYRVHPSNPRFYVDFTGCGNTLNMQHPRVLQLIMDSLRYWVLEMHVDGFRFDLASALARELYEVNQLAAFFDIIHQDPILSQVKLIAEPWDLGEGGYQVGNFPVLWTEWNGEYRDCVRSYWRGDRGYIGKFATRITGSSDYYGGVRRPYASINFVTCHDGFPLQDLVSYNSKHNEANGEEGRDGTTDNRSFNYGVEGPTEDTKINSLRAQAKRNIIATLLLSAGVPMISGGDEIGRTQHGNNNAYCHDGHLSWYNWDLSKEQKEFFIFITQLIAFRRSQPVLQRRKFFTGQLSEATTIKDIIWYSKLGHEMTDQDWGDPGLNSLGVCLAGDAIDEVDERGRRIMGSTLLMLFNASENEVNFVLPYYCATERLGARAGWSLLMETIECNFKRTVVNYEPRSIYGLVGKSMSLFRLTKGI